MSFDPNAPHSKYSGGELPAGAPAGTMYRQNGFYLNGRGEPLAPVDSEIAAVTIEEIVVEDVSPDPEEMEPATVDYEAMHWTQLRKLMKERGQPWDGREPAIAYLSNVA